MRGSHRSTAQRQRSDAPACRGERIDEPGGGDDIGDGVLGTDLVEGDRVDGNAVHAGLGLGKQGEDANGMGTHGGRERRGFEIGPNAGPARMAVRMAIMVVVVVVMLVTMMVMVMIMRRRMVIVTDREAAAGQHMVAVGQQPTADTCGLGRGRHRAVPQMRKGIEHAGDEHVAGRAAQRVEMEVMGARRHGKSLRCPQ